MAGKDIIELNEMVFFAYHGVLDSEKELGQRFILNFKAELDYSKAAVNDNLEQTVNYAEIYYKIKEVFLAKKYDLLESAAYNIIKNLFIEFPKLELIEIKIKKPAVPIEGALANAAVKIWGPRTIDIDILFYDNLEYQSQDLIIPHPEIRKRAFVLIPLVEAAEEELFIDNINITKWLDKLDSSSDEVEFYNEFPELNLNKK